MRKLTLRPRLGEASLTLLEDIVGQKFTEYFREFLKANAGLSHLESKFIDSAGTTWYVQQYNDFKDLYGLTQEFIQSYNHKFVPFAYDPSGWHFCLCFDEGNINSIYINRWSDHLPEEQFLKICDSFETFIDSLVVEEG